MFLKISKVLSITNTLFWLTLSISYLFTSNNTFLKLLVLAEPFIFGFILWGLINRNTLIYKLALPFTFLNTLLSLTDQMGIMDWLSLVLSLTLFISLLTARKEILNSK